MARRKKKGEKKPDNTQVGWHDFLLLVPMRNRAARIEDEEDGSFAVTVSVKKPWWFIPPVKWIVPMGAKRVVKLDPLGKMIWNACDDKQRVEDLVDMIAASEGLTFHEARVAVTQHLRELVRRGVLVLAAVNATKPGKV
jgi:hypothetical protein